MSADFALCSTNLSGKMLLKTLWVKEKIVFSPLLTMLFSLVLKKKKKIIKTNVLCDIRLASYKLSFPNDKILDQSISRRFVEDKINVTRKFIL